MYVYHFILFPEMLNMFEETFVVTEMHMFRHEPFVFVGGGGGTYL